MGTPIGPVGWMVADGAVWAAAALCAMGAKIDIGPAVAAGIAAAGTAAAARGSAGAASAKGCIAVGGTMGWAKEGNCGIGSPEAPLAWLMCAERGSK